MGGTVFGNEGGVSVRVVVGRGKFDKGWPGDFLGKRGIRALLEARPPVASEKDMVLHCPEGQ